MSTPCIKNGTLLARKTQLAAEHTEQYIVGNGLFSVRKLEKCK
jgi:hypothetical protein